MRPLAVGIEPVRKAPGPGCVTFRIDPLKGRASGCARDPEDIRRILERSLVCREVVSKRIWPAAYAVHQSNGVHTVRWKSEKPHDSVCRNFREDFVVPIVLIGTRR